MLVIVVVCVWQHSEPPGGQYSIIHPPHYYTRAASSLSLALQLERKTKYGARDGLRLIRRTCFNKILRAFVFVVKRLSSTLFKLDNVNKLDLQSKGEKRLELH